MNATNAELVSLVAGEVDAATLASRHGVTEERVDEWRSAFVAGLKAAGAVRPMGSPRASRLLIAVGVVAATAALAQSLTPMVPDMPARADEINDNFNLLKQWLEAKVGAVGTSDVTSGNINSDTLKVRNDASVDGALRVHGQLTATGGLSASTTVPGTVYGGATLYCTADSKDSYGCTSWSAGECQAGCGGVTCTKGSAQLVASGWCYHSNGNSYCRHFLCIQQ